ncbi:hypothetical protein DFH08DRAFT_816490 [Mycena albidolilacea]|uniref:Uncharacterized protein n=1 Tax=Mycena albidolilacea TaxID=1033008 RepID=A0AAD6ZLM3_9AGAR|nr:hypothetical protein DFH08DRAFT_816490 [Mycena albidolilacea]
MAPWVILVMVRFVFCYIFVFFPNPDELGYFIAHPERCAWPNGNEQTFSMHVVPLSDLTFISMATKRPSPSKKSNYSGEDSDGVGDVVESDGEEEGHDEGMPKVECIVDSLGTAMTTKHKSKLFSDHLDVPAAEYLNSLDIQGRLFSNFREKELVIFVANDAPNQSAKTLRKSRTSRIRLLSIAQNYKVFAGFRRCLYLLPFFGAFQRAQELTLFNSKAPIQSDGTAIVVLSNITSIFGRNGGPVAVTTRLTDILILVPGSKVVNKMPETPAASNPIAKSGAPPKRLKVKMGGRPEAWRRNLWLHVPNICASVDKTDQQEAMQALPENFEMTESFTIWKPEDETSMQLLQI